MAAPDDRLYEYAVIRYVPRVDREEFINIGLIMMNKRHKWIKGKVFIDCDRIKSLFPYAELETLKNQSLLFERKDLPKTDLPVEDKYRWLTAVKSACLQVSPSHPGLLPSEDTFDTFNKLSKPEERISESLEKEFSRLFNLLIL